jgi:hypothetical protein
MANKQNRPKKGSFPLTPGAQVVVTGKPVDSATAKELRDYTKTFFIGNFCSKKGEIGYVDEVFPNIDSVEITRMLQELAESFPALEMGVSFMTSKPGLPGYPVVSFAIKNGRSKRDENAHLGHPSPRRV